MIKEIICHLNTQLATTGLYQKNYGITEIINKSPKAYTTAGQWEDIQYSKWKGCGYWRKTSNTQIIDLNGNRPCDNLLEHTFSVRLISYIPKSMITDDAYSDDVAAQKILKLLTDNTGTVVTEIGANNINITPKSINTNGEEILQQEYPELKTKLDMRYKTSYFTIDFEVNVIIYQSCIKTC